MVNTRKIHPIGKVEYDPESRTLTFVDGIIEETRNGEFVDPQKRTYYDVEKREDGSYDINEKLCLRERSDAEKQRDLEKILAEEPSIIGIITGTPLKQIPIKLTKHVYNMAAQNVKWQTRNLKRAIRRRKLEKRLKDNNLVLNDLDRDTLTYECSALEYIWRVAAEVLESEGSQSELFEEVGNKLLTKKEKELMIKNVRSGEHSQWCIAGACDRRYSTGKITELFRTARDLSEKYRIAEDDYTKHLVGKVESSPLFELTIQ